MRGSPPRLAAGVEAVATLGALDLPSLPDVRPGPAGDGAPALQQRDDGPLRHVLDWLYEANESTAGSVAIAGLSFVPGVDTALDAADVALNIDRVSQAEHRSDPEAWTNLGLTAVGVAIPFAGDVVEAALKAVLRGGRQAAVEAVERVSPLLQRAGVDPAAFFDDLAERVPELLETGVDRGVRGLQDLLGTLGEKDRWLVPDAIEAAAGPAARELGRLAEQVREPLQGVANEIREAFQDLATAARSAERGVDGAGAKALDAQPGARTGAPGGPEEPDFRGRLRGEDVTLPGVPTERLTLTRRTREETAALRADFDGRERGSFLQALANDPERVNQLREAGLFEAQIALMRNGRGPGGNWQVHHKVPLDLGGTNRFDNLVIMQHEPYHKVVTNFQNNLNLDVGGPTTVDWPMLQGFIYPPRPLQ